MTKKNVKILIKELNTSGIDVNISGMNMRRHRLGSRSKKKDQIDRLEDDLDKTLSTLPAPDISCVNTAVAPSIYKIALALLSIL